jgi:hypothetical protein
MEYYILLKYSLLLIMGQQCLAPTDSKPSLAKGYLISSSSFRNIVEITSKDIAEDWFNPSVIDIEDLHLKEIEFEVVISNIKLREMHKNVLLF